MKKNALGTKENGVPVALRIADALSAAQTIPESVLAVLTVPGPKTRTAAQRPSWRRLRQSRPKTPNSRDPSAR